MWRDCYKLPDGWTPAQGQEGRGAGGGRGRGRGGRGGRGGGVASMKSVGNESELRDDRFPGQFFFVSTQAPAGPEKDEGFEEPAAVGKVTLHSLDYWVIDSGATYSMTPPEVKGMGKAMFKGADEKMVGLKNVLWVPNLAANLISVRRLQKAGIDTSSKGAKTYTARLGERILWDLHKDRDVYNEMWQIPMVPMPKERQVAASISTKGEAVGSGDGANGRAKEIKSKKCNLGGTSKLGEHDESGAAAQKQHKGEENPKAAAEEYGENMWGTIASAAFSNPTSATGKCDWLTLHRRMGHVALPILQRLVKNEMVAGIRVKGEPDEVLGCPTCMQAKFTRYPFSSSEATAKAPLDEVVMDVVGPLKLGAAGAEYFLTIGDPDAPDIPTPRSYAEAIEGPYSSQWQAAMDTEMASWKSTGTYVNEVPPPRANIVSGMWIFRVKRPPGSPPVFKARYVARGFSQRQGVDFFQNFSPTPKMITQRVLLHVAAQRDYELHSLDFSTAFLQGSLHEEIWLRRPPGFTGSFPAGT
ncbi:unnamed protein product [Closterium sp. NIES-53]